MCMFVCVYVCVCMRSMYCIKASKRDERKNRKVKYLVLGGISEQIIDGKKNSRIGFVNVSLCHAWRKIYALLVQEGIYRSS